MARSKEKKRQQDHQRYLEHRQERCLYARQYHLEHLQEIRKRKQQHYLKHREEMLKRKHEYYQDHVQEILGRHKQYVQTIRQDALVKYGGNPPKCACCGEDSIIFLCIDHINGGGNKHRKAIGGKGGSSFFLWLRKQDYPKGFRVLCHNCNFSLGHYGYCPHQD